MANVADLRAGLATRLRLTGLTAYERPQAPMQPPCVVIQQLRPEHNLTLGEGTLARYDGELVVYTRGAGGLGNAGALMEPYIDSTGDQSIYAAIAGDRTLGGIAHLTWLGQWSDFEDEELESGDYYSQRAPVTIWAG